MRPSRFQSFAMLLLGAVFVPACASASSGSGDARSVMTISTESGDYRIERTRSDRSRSETLPVSAREIWSVLPGVYRELEIPVGTMDSQRMMYGNTRHRVSRRLADRRLSTYFRCGRSGGFGGEIADAAPLTLSVLTTITGRGAEDDEEATVRTVAAAETRGADGTSALRECTSTGALEALITTMIQYRFAERAVSGG